MLHRITNKKPKRWNEWRSRSQREWKGKGSQSLTAFFQKILWTRKLSWSIPLLFADEEKTELHFGESAIFEISRITWKETASPNHLNCCTHSSFLFNFQILDFLRQFLLSSSQSLQPRLFLFYENRLFTGCRSGRSHLIWRWSWNWISRGKRFGVRSGSVSFWRWKRSY